MTPALADTIIKALTEAILANNEPLARLFDENAVAALLKVSPAIGKFIPGDENTIFDRYVMEIDREATKQLEQIIIIKRTHGHVNLAFDPATINGNSKVRYCCFCSAAAAALLSVTNSNYFIIIIIIIIIISLSIICAL